MAARSPGRRTVSNVSSGRPGGRASMAQNPVINRFGRMSGGNQPTPSAAELQNMYNQPAYTGPVAGERWMTLDDVVQRTAAMLGTVLVAGALSWVALPDSAFLPALFI